MYALNPKNLPYILWRIVFKKSRSRGSSLSNNSNNWKKTTTQLQFDHQECLRKQNRQNSYRYCTGLVQFEMGKKGVQVDTYVGNFPALQRWLWMNLTIAINK